MVYGYHVVFGAYGFWLPNDPRGSWSDFVGSWELFRFGHATKSDTRRSVAQAPHDRASRLAAKEALMYPPVQFNGLQARAVGRGFGNYLKRSGVVLWACSILPEHVHLVIARHTYPVEQIVNLLKRDAARELIAESLHPFADRPLPNGRLPKAFAGKEWKVFLDTPQDILRAVWYVERNPIKEGKPIQQWSFVTSFNASAVYFSRDPKGSAAAVKTSGWDASESPIL
jgi:REP element-mobilizing transposase RayT